MAQEKILLSRKKVEEIKKQLLQLIEVERPKVIKQIQEAREQGDLSENADYDAAKNYQAEVEGKIKELEHIINFCELIDENETSFDNSTVKVGSTVEIFDMDDQRSYTYTIVGAVEADPDQNKISNLSPLAAAVLGKKKDTIVEVRGAKNKYQVKILKISR